jgi:hypothetical protein
LTCLLGLCGCGGQRQAHVTRAALERYVREVEPIRLGVNALLQGADPIFAGLAQRRISRAEAARSMDLLERRFAAYAVQIAAVDPPEAQLRALNAPYADTYVLEDSYLSALAAGIESGNLDGLPNTQASQRAAIIRWRIGLTVLARTVRAALPGDLQQAGRGEIAPSPTGS